MGVRASEEGCLAASLGLTRRNDDGRPGVRRSCDCRPPAGNEPELPASGSLEEAVAEDTGAESLVGDERGLRRGDASDNAGLVSSITGEAGICITGSTTHGGSATGRRAQDRNQARLGGIKAP